MQSLGLAPSKPSEIAADGQPTPIETQLALSDHSKQTTKGASWMSVIIGSTGLNALLLGVGIKVRFIFGMALPLFLQLMARSAMRRSLLLAALWLIGAIGVYVLLTWFWRTAVRGRIWPFCAFLLFYLPDIYFFVRAKNLIELICHIIATGFLLYGMAGAFFLRGDVKAATAQRGESAVPTTLPQAS